MSTNIVDKNLNEFSLIPPIGQLPPADLVTKHYIPELSLTINSNASLKKALLKQISERDEFRSLLSVVESDLKSNKLIIGYLSTGYTRLLMKRGIDYISNLLKSIINKVSSIAGLDYYLAESAYTIGFYVPKTGQIVLILDDNVDLIKYTAKTELGKVLLHEYCHKASIENNSKFFKSFKKEYIRFFKVFLNCTNSRLSRSTKNKETPKFSKSFDYELEQTISSLLSEEKKTALAEGPSRVVNLWYNFLKNQLEGPVTDEYIANLLRLMFIPLEVHTSAPRLDLKSLNFYRNSMLCFFNSYLSIGYASSKPEIGFGQELIFPSEVIAVLSSYCSETLLKKITKNIASTLGA